MKLAAYCNYLKKKNQTIMLVIIWKPPNFKHSNPIECYLERF